MDWQFRAFGISTSAEKNRLEKTADGLKLKAAVFAEDGQVSGKGGKLMRFFDGISYYYTSIPAACPYFSAEAVIRLDRLNPTPDGQEGFALLVRDCLGEDGDGENCYMANSAAVLATALPTAAGRKVRDCLGWRFVWDLDPVSAAANVRGAAESLSGAFADGALRIREGESYRLRLTRDEAGFHVGLPDVPGAEAHFPAAERMLRLNKDYWYIGVAAARGVEITITELKLETGDAGRARRPERYPLPQPPARIKLLRSCFAPGESNRLSFAAASSGRLELWFNGQSLGSRKTEAGGIISFPLHEQRPGNYPLRWLFQTEGKKLAGESCVTLHRLGRESLWLGPQGSREAAGTREDPQDLAFVLPYAEAGMSFFLLPGIYTIKHKLEVPYGCSGTPERPIRLLCPHGTAVIDFAGEGGPFELNGDYWQLENITLRRSGPNLQGLKAAGSFNRLRHLNFTANGNTGLQISGSEDLKPSYWPAGNEVSFCVSADNADPGQNNADGFAAKLAAGAGNVFRGCLAYNNIDDGWDLYSRIENGPIGSVLIEYCLCFRNGHNSAGDLRADGNGFKLGGEGIATAHRLRASLAAENDADGITSNSNPAVVLENCFSEGSGERNYALYGQGRPADLARAVNCLSGRGDLGTVPPHLAGCGIKQAEPAGESFTARWKQLFLAQFPEETEWLEKALQTMCKTAR